MNPGGQRQSYEAIPSWHVPPLLQGLSLQSSISETLNFWLLLKHIFVSSHIKTIRMKQFTRTCTTAISNKPMEAIARKGVDSIDTFTVIHTWIWITVIDVYVTQELLGYYHAIYLYHF